MLRARIERKISMDALDSRLNAGADLQELAVQGPTRRLLAVAM